MKASVVSLLLGMIGLLAVSIVLVSNSAKSMHDAAGIAADSSSAAATGQQYSAQRGPWAAGSAALITRAHPAPKADADRMKRPINSQPSGQS